MDGRGLQATLLEGVPGSALGALSRRLAEHHEPLAISRAAWQPGFDDWLAPALVQVDTYWDTAFFDAMLSNLQAGRQDEDMRDALIDALRCARRTNLTWFAADGEVANPVFRLRAFIEAHRSISYTIPADVDDATLRVALEMLGDAVAYSTDVESELSHDGTMAGVFEVQMVYVAAAGMWMEAHFDEAAWDDDEEDSEITY